jgi:hypothetical protein
MGAWEFGPFENDAALDWLADFLESPEVGLAWAPLSGCKAARVRRALRRPYRNKHLDMGVTEEAVAACEVIAAVGGKPVESASDELREWARGTALSLDSQRPAALRVAKFLRDAPAFKELFFDPEDHPKWQAHMDDLIGRLS